MKILKWKEIAELIGLLAIVASLVFVGLQLNQTQKIAIAEMGWSNMAAEMESRSRIYDFPDVWSRGNAGEELSAADRVIYRMMIMDFNTLQFYRTINMLILYDDPAAADPVVSDVAGFLIENPGARKEWEAIRAQFKRHRTMGGTEESNNIYEEMVRARLAEMERILGANQNSSAGTE